MKFTAEPGSLFVLDGSTVVAGSALIAAGKVPQKLDTLLRRLIGELGRNEVSGALSALEGHVLLVGGPIICMPGNLPQLRSAFRQAGLDAPGLGDALTKAYGGWSGARGYEEKKRKR